MGDNQEMKRTLDAIEKMAVAIVDKNQSRLISLSDKIHAHPELGFQEYKAVQWITEELSAIGFTVETGVAGLKTAFRAHYQGSRKDPNIGFIVEYDALPSLGHACGHNTKGPVTIGSVQAIIQALKDVPGTLTVIGTPAEESGAGKVIMADGGTFGDLDAAIALSVGPRNMTGLSTLASRTLEITVHGVSAHSHAQPHAGKNALSALISGFNQVDALRQQFTSDVRVNGIITKGGSSVGAIPVEAGAEFLISTDHSKTQAPLEEKIRQLFVDSAKAHGCRIDVRPGLLYREMKLNGPLIALIEETFEAIDLEVGKPSFGGGTGATDMGNVSQVVPADSVWLSLGSEIMPHTETFAEACKSEPGHRALVNAAKVGAIIGLVLLGDTDRVAAITSAFQT